MGSSIQRCSPLCRPCSRSCCPTGPALESLLDVQHSLRERSRGPPPHVTTAARGQGMTAGVDQYDGQGSGGDYNLGGGFAPPTGWVNNTDGGRSVLFPDYKQN